MSLAQPRTTPQVRIKNHTSSELTALLSEVGVTPRLARQLQSAAVRRGALEIPRVLPETSPYVLARVGQVASIPALELIDKIVSPRDGFTRYLFRGDGPDLFEAVRIPLLHRAGDLKHIVCVSSQVGCALRCDFCATGRLGFRRNLATWEIVDQVVHIQRDSVEPVRGVVFMGMGEPMLNYDSVMRAAEVISEPCGMAISAKAITISTVGIVPAIQRFTSERRPFRLIVSLTKAESSSRKLLLPIEATYPLPELIAALREYQAATGKRITLAWTLISGYNTSQTDARELAELTRGLAIKLDLIDVNDSTGRYVAPSDEERNHFRDALRVELGMPVARRYSGGQDIDGGCGMLAGAAGGTGE
ncbi:MAG TPA: radical SAM protein [Thermoanaerobaculia bacterium]|nr:radical SAM protein [Thermoanaerobaculia bacterium]